MKTQNILFSILSLVVFTEAAAILSPRDLFINSNGVCPPGTAKAGEKKGFHDDSTSRLVTSLTNKTSPGMANL
jgi:hypothetical protein